MLAVEALNQHRVEQAKVRLQVGSVYKDHGLVGARPTGEPIRLNSLSPAFAKLVQRAGVPTVRFHDLRHGHASQLLKIHTNPKIVSERLGLSTVGLSLDVSSHLLPGVQEQAVEPFDAKQKTYEAAPGKVSLAALNRVLRKVGFPAVERSEVAPLLVA